MNNMGQKIIAIAGCIFFILFAEITYCGDLDDGISLEDSTIDDFDSIKVEKNINFITINAKSKANVKANGGKETVTGNGDVVMGGAIIKEGAEINGDVIVIFEGNDETLIVDQ